MVKLHIVVNFKCRHELNTDEMSATYLDIPIGEETVHQSEQEEVVIMQLPQQEDTVNFNGILSEKNI